MALIEKREAMLPTLEIFEQGAADPLRYYRNDSKTREQENRMRADLLSKLKDMEVQVHQVLQEIKQTYGDVVTFQGIPGGSSMLLYPYR